jgi:hypothetical protein
MKTIGFSTMTVVCQAFSGPKIDYWSRKPMLSPWFGS